MNSVMSIALSCLIAFLDSEREHMLYYDDEIGTLPKIDGLEMIFSASRYRRISIGAIIQSFVQL